MLASQQQQPQNSNAANNAAAAATAALNKQCLTINHVLQRCRLNDPVHVRRMNVCGSSLDDISIMKEFNNVEVCSFSANDIQDLEALRSCSRLQELHLRKNRINDFQQLLHLSHLPLRAIGLSENPIASHPVYRKFVISALPQLQRLDDVDVSPSERQDAEREVSDPFTVAQEVGPVEGSSSPQNSFSPAATSPASTSPPRLQQQQQAQQQQQRPQSSGGLNARRRQHHLDQQQQQQQQQEASATYASFDRQQQQAQSAQQQASSSPSNAYNGDDVPIGAAIRRPKGSRNENNINKNSNNNNNNNTNKARRADPFGSSTVVEPSFGNPTSPYAAAAAAAGGGSSSNIPAAAAAAAADQQQHQGFYSQDSQQQATQLQILQQQIQQQESSSVKAVKALLDTMSQSARAEIKRYINTI